MRAESVWALVENLLFGFPSSGGRCPSVHGCVSVHAVVELREDVRDLHHLTGHYRWGNRAASGKPLRLLQDWAVRERMRLAI